MLEILYQDIKTVIYNCIRYALKGEKWFNMQRHKISKNQR